MPTDGRTDRLKVPGVGGELLLQHGVVPAEYDGLLVVLVSVPDGDVPLLSHVQNRAGEVGLDEADHGFLLGVEALQGLHLICPVGGNRSAVNISALAFPQWRIVEIQVMLETCRIAYKRMIPFRQRSADYVLLGVIRTGAGIRGLLRRGDIGGGFFSQASCKCRIWLFPALP